MFKQKSYLDPSKITTQLSDLLDIKIKDIKTQFQDTGHTGNVHKIEILDHLNNSLKVIIKKVENSSYYLFYKEILEPFNLDSPKIYGDIKTEDGLFLVIEYIPYKPISWVDEDRFKRAVDWLVIRDTTIHDNFSKIRELACIKTPSSRAPFTYRIDDCVNIIKGGVDVGLSPLLSDRFLQALVDNKEFLYRLATSVSKKGRLTVSHYDFQMNNILFGSEDKEGKIYVLDWSGPRIDSVCIDLVGLVRSAPEPIRPTLREIYRSQIDFDDFETIYHEAEILVNLSDFAWMVEMIIDGQKGNIDLSAFELQARNIQDYLFSPPNRDRRRKEINT